MQTTFELTNEFCEAAMLNKEHDPWLRRRENGKHYAMVIIASCEHENWWYKDFIGVECMVELRFYRWGTLAEGIVVRLTNTKVHHGRSLSAKDFIII